MPDYNVLKQLLDKYARWRVPEDPMFQEKIYESTIPPRYAKTGEEVMDFRGHHPSVTGETPMTVENPAIAQGTTDRDKFLLELLRMSKTGK